MSFDGLIFVFFSLSVVVRSRCSSFSSSIHSCPAHRPSTTPQTFPVFPFELSLFGFGSDANPHLSGLRTSDELSWVATRRLSFDGLLIN